MVTELLDGAGEVEKVIPEWDRLAVEAGRPYAAPGWAMAWWRHVAPPGARLRVIVARDDGRLVGVAAFHATPWRAGLWTWALLASDMSSRTEPVAEADAHQAIARALKTASPPAARIDLHGVPPSSPWPVLLGGSPEGAPPWHRRKPAVPAPVVELSTGGVDDWLGTRSSNFRSQMRRARRKLEKDGAVFRVARSSEEIDRDLMHFERLHNARWEWRGGSMAMPSGALRMLADAGRTLGPQRFQLVSLELDGRVINSQLFICAGREMSYWNGGFDDEFASYKPSLAGLVEAIRLAMEQGCDRFDLGAGAQDYKARFTDVESEVVWQTSIPRWDRYPLARALYAPLQARHDLGRRLTPSQKQRLEQLARRLPGRSP